MQFSIKEKKRLKARYGPWAVITGASSGIGLELATKLAEADFNLVINSRCKEALKTVEENLRRISNVDILIVDADVSTGEGIEKLINTTKDLNVGLFIGSAGFGTSGNFINSSMDIELTMLKVNCEAVFSLSHHYAKLFAQKKRGGIILMSSLVAFQGTPLAANYAASKAYVQCLAEGLSEELKPYGVDVLSAAPGPVDSGFAQRANMKMSTSLLPSQVGVPILRALGRKTTVLPGVLTKLLVYSLRLCPQWARIKIMKKVMGRMTQHQRMSETK